MHAAATPAAATERRRIRMDGHNTLVDVARKVCGDPRLAPLLQDLNPTLPATGALPAGTVVTCPGKQEAARFAKRMGFTLGFDERAGNGTDARRRFARHLGLHSDPGKVDAVALARSMLARAVSPLEVGKRLARQCDDADLATLLQATEPAVRQAAQHAEAHALFPRAVSRLSAVRNVLDATARPAGLLALLEALAKDAAAADRLLQGCAVAPALRKVLAEEAGRVVALVRKAREVAGLERGARDATVKGDADAAQLKKIVDALADGVDALGGDRAAVVGLEAEVDALNRHLEMVRGALRQAEDGLGRASAEVIRTVARGLDGQKLPRPWPLLTSVTREVGAAIDQAPPTARDLGLGGLLRRRGASAEGAPVRLTVADLQVRAASCARAVDEGEAFAERLAPKVAELFGLMRPPPAVDGGTPQARKARRRAAFDHAVAARGAARPDGVSALVGEVVDRARLGGNGAAGRLNRVQMAALDEAARAVSSSPLTIHRQPMSELGRALVVAAMALDREVGQGLLRPTGREAFVAAAVKHAGRVLSAASLAL